VSSTAHLLIGEKLLGFQDPDGVFTIMIQLGSIFAIVWLYRVKIVKVVAALPSDPDARRFAAAIVVAVIPALVAGALFSTFVKSVLYESPAVFAASFIIGGVVMLVVERSRPAPTILNAEHTPVGRAFGVGLCQMLVAIPTMIAAFAHELLDVRTSLAPEFAAEIAIGFVTAFIASALVVRPFLGFIRRAGFAPFAWYRIALGLLIFAALAAGWR
jgi:undecaprenyl-diphosphatase